MEDDIHRSIKYEIWCSTDHGNKRLDDAFKERQKNGGRVLLFFSVNGSGHFCGMAQMMTEVDYNCTSSVWSQDKWKGKFKVKWIYVKDVPNIKFRHIRLENNENKSVTNSRDAQEVPNAPGIEVLQILHDFHHTTSIFDDFNHYEKKQKEVTTSKKPLSTYDSNNMSSSHMSPVNRHYGRQTDDSRDYRNNSQKYFMSGSNSGSVGSSGGGYRERSNNNNSNRTNNGGYYSGEHRRYDSHRSTDKDTDSNTDKERERENNSNDYGNRYAQKFDNNRRNDEQQQQSQTPQQQQSQQQTQQQQQQQQTQQRTQIKQNNRERDLSDEQNTEARFRNAP